GNVGDIANGFYIDTRDSSGQPGTLPQLQLYGGIGVLAFAGFDLDFGVASVTIAAGVYGGLFTTISFTLHDPNPDGKVHINEIGATLSQGIGNVFDTDGKMSVIVGAFIKIELGFAFFTLTLIDESPILADITLASFSHQVVPEPQPTLATN